VTSYQLKRDGILNTISGSVPDSQTAPCWIAITPDGRFAYAVNTGSAVISGYQVSYNGELSLLGNGVTAQTASAPLDNAFTRNAATCTMSLEAVQSSDIRWRPTDRSLFSTRPRRFPPAPEGWSRNRSLKEPSADRIVTRRSLTTGHEATDASSDIWLWRGR
jgi:hypothetical protein